MTDAERDLLSDPDDDNAAGAAADASADGNRLARFESSIAELETLVESLESGDVDLEQALERFERGVVLARECQRTLAQAELRIDQLLSDDPQAATAPFEPDAADTARSGD